MSQVREEAAGGGPIWVMRGAWGAFSLPAFVLVAAFVGFGGLLRESSFTLAQGLGMTAMVWALPSMVVLVGSAASGAGLLAIALAVSLSAVRLMPMTVSLVPLLRRPGMPVWHLLVLSHFVAVTAWVEANLRLPSLPVPARAPYFLGFAGMLIVFNMLALAGGFVLSDALPTVLAAGLFLLTPVYFLLSLTTAARSLAERLATPFGLVLGPLAYLVAPGFDLLISGLVAGSLAFAIDRARVQDR